MRNEFAHGGDIRADMKAIHSKQHVNDVHLLSVLLRVYYFLTQCIVSKTCYVPVP